MAWRLHGGHVGGCVAVRVAVGVAVMWRLHGGWRDGWRGGWRGGHTEAGQHAVGRDLALGPLSRPLVAPLATDEDSRSPPRSHRRRNFPPLTPHHTQAFTVLMMSRFFGDYLKDAEPKAKDTGGGWNFFTRPKLDLRAFIAQMATGEGKSIVIAMLAVFMVQLHGLKVHVLENNEGLLDRDYATNKPFFDAFGIKCGIDLLDPDAQIVYCLKSSINRLFLRKMVEGQLDEVLGQTVIIVDEVDDLVVNENPNAHYAKEDAERTPDLRKCFAALRDEEILMPRGVRTLKIWEDAKKAVAEANRRVEGVDYRVVEVDGKKRAVILVNGAIPKVARTAPWLSYLNYKISDVEPSSESPFATVCTPYVFNKYRGIFGLSGSVGGQAELTYLASTYGAVKFEVPRFLDTCTGDARKVVTNHGVELVRGESALITRVVQLCAQWVRKVPVLVITSGPEELNKMLAAVRECDGVVADEVQRFALFDEEGRSLKDQWETLIADATKRLGGPSDNRCRVTVTDKFGGRGHDYQVAAVQPPRGRRVRGRRVTTHAHAKCHRAHAMSSPCHRKWTRAAPVRPTRAATAPPGDGQGREQERRHARDRDVGARRARVDPVARPHRAAGPAGPLPRGAQPAVGAVHHPLRAGRPAGGHGLA